MDYSRQISLIGSESQQRINEGLVLVLGAGGLGSFVAMALAASGVKHLVLVDFDQVSNSNLHRQFLYKLKDVGRAKVTVLSEQLKALNPEINVLVQENYFDRELGDVLFPKVDLIVDCLDHMPSKYLASDLAVVYGKPLVYGSLYKQTAYVSCFNFRNASGLNSAHLRDYFKASKTQVDLSCQQVGILNPIVNVCAGMQVDLALKVLMAKQDELEDAMQVIGLDRYDIFKLKPNKSRMTRAAVVLLRSQLNKEIHWEELKEDDLLYTPLNRGDLPDYLSKREVVCKDELNLDELLSDGSIDRVYVFCKRGISSLNLISEHSDSFKNVEFINVVGGLETYDKGK